MMVDHLIDELWVRPEPSEAEYVWPEGERDYVMRPFKDTTNQLAKRPGTCFHGGQRGLKISTNSSLTPRRFVTNILKDKYFPELKDFFHAKHLPQVRERLNTGEQLVYNKTEHESKAFDTHRRTNTVEEVTKRNTCGLELIDTTERKSVIVSSSDKRPIDNKDWSYHDNSPKQPMLKDKKERINTSIKRRKLDTEDVYTAVAKNIVKQINGIISHQSNDLDEKVDVEKCIEDKKLSITTDSHFSVGDSDTYSGNPDHKEGDWLLRGHFSKTTYGEVSSDSTENHRTDIQQGSTANLQSEPHTEINIGHGALMVEKIDVKDMQTVYQKHPHTESPKQSKNTARIQSMLRAIGVMKPTQFTFHETSETQANWEAEQVTKVVKTMSSTVKQDDASFAFNLDVLPTTGGDSEQFHTKMDNKIVTCQTLLEGNEHVHASDSAERIIKTDMSDLKIEKARQYRYDNDKYDMQPLRSKLGRTINTAQHRAKRKACTRRQRHVNIRQKHHYRYGTHRFCGQVGRKQKRENSRSGKNAEDSTQSRDPIKIKHSERRRSCKHIQTCHQIERSSNEDIQDVNKLLREERRTTKRKKSHFYQYSLIQAPSICIGDISPGISIIILTSKSTNFAKVTPIRSEHLWTSNDFRRTDRHGGECKQGHLRHIGLEGFDVVISSNSKLDDAIMVDLQTKLIENSLAQLNPSQTESELAENKEKGNPSPEKCISWFDILRLLTWLPTEQLETFKTSITVAPGFDPMMNVLDRISVGERVRPNESMRYETLRLCSFRRYPADNKPFLIRFAQAGFYYASNGDEVICYCCGKRISNWKEEDDPMEIHRRVSPSCSFMINNSEVNVNVTPRPDEKTHTSQTKNDPTRAATMPSITRDPTCSGQGVNELVMCSSNIASNIENALSTMPRDNHQCGNISTDENNRVGRDITETCAFAARAGERDDFQTNCEYDELDSPRTLDHEQNDATFTFMSLPSAVNQEGQPEDKLYESKVNSSPANKSGNSKSGFQERSQQPASTSRISQPSDSERVQHETQCNVQQPGNTSQRYSRKEAVSNVRLGTETNSPTHMSKHPRFATQTSRMTSFNMCLSIAVPPERCSEAGLFYAGTADCTRCFHCGIGLRHWSADDDPWVEHARFSIDCDFVRRKKGEEFVHLIRLALAYTEQNSNIESATGATTPPLVTENAEEVTTSPRTTTRADENFDTLMKTDAAESIKEMGYSDHIIKTAMAEVIKHRGRVGLSAIPIMEQIFAIEELNRSTSNTSEPTLSRSDSETSTLAAASGQTQQSLPTYGVDTLTVSSLSISDSPSERIPKQHALSGKSGQPVAKTSISLKSGRTASSELNDTRCRRRKLKKENVALQTMSMCSKCKTRDVCIVFLPCGHLITCEDCAPSMRKCSQCGQVIKGTVRTYRS